MADTSVQAQSITVAGASFAVDQDGSGFLWPYSKLVFGASGTQTEVSTSNPLPVSIFNPSLPVTQSGTWNMAGVTSVGAVNAVTSIGTVVAVNAVTSLGAIASALPAGTNNIGQTQNVPGTSGGMSKPLSITNAAGLNLTLVKTGAGQVYAINVHNLNANPVYLKFFDVAGTVNVTMGTTTCDWQVGVPANATASLGAGIAWPFDPGYSHASGIVIALTGGIAKADNTSLSASVAIVNVGYK